MIPIGDTTRRRSVPYVTYALIGINLLIFIYQLMLSEQVDQFGRSELDLFIRRWGNVPPCTFDALGWDQGTIVLNTACEVQPRPALTPLTSMFMHVGWLHIMGNMLFLWIFGDNVEEATGHALFAVFYVLCGLAAAAAHGLVNQDSLVPALGASGAIAGVLGAYLLLYPRSLVIAIIPPIFFLPLPIPAFIVIGLWFAIELFSGLTSLDPGVADVGSGIAYFAHIGGFVAGALLVNVFAIHRDRARALNRTTRRSFG